MVRGAPSPPREREVGAPQASWPAGSPACPVPSAPPPPAPTAGRRGKLRHFHWEVLPAQRVRGRRNLWTAGARPGGFGLDLRLLEELFGRRAEVAGGGLRGPPAGQASLLDAKKILNLGIFLKQFKRPAQAIVADIRDGAGAPYGAEKLLELAKMLPDGEEVKRLEAFRGSPSRLSEAEVFALLLVRLPSYARRLELLVLKEEFFPRLHALRSAVQVTTEAASELLTCGELHDLLRLVLEAGNHLNEGGYAGSALGFRMSSLLRLADTKANRPGVDLLHFVALDKKRRVSSGRRYVTGRPPAAPGEQKEAERKDPGLLFFPRKLPHVGPASRVLGQEVVAELQSLGQRLRGAREGLEALDLKAQMEPFLRAAEAQLSIARASLDGLKRATAALCDFLCEEPETFSLAECCRIFQAFGERLLLAAQENRAREASEQRRRRQEQARQEQQQQQRRSIASCSSRDPGLLGVELDLLFLGGPRPGRGCRSLQGPHPPSGNPQAQERPLGLRRRHTLALLPPCPGPAPPGQAERAELLGQGLPGSPPCRKPPRAAASPPFPRSSSSQGEQRPPQGGLRAGRR